MTSGGGLNKLCWKKVFLKNIAEENCILFFNPFIGSKKHIKLSRDAVFTTCSAH